MSPSTPAPAASPVIWRTQSLASEALAAPPHLSPPAAPDSTPATGPRVLFLHHGSSSHPEALAVAAPLARNTPPSGTYMDCTLISCWSESNGPTQKGLPLPPCLKLPSTPPLLPPLTFLLSTYCPLTYYVICSFFLVIACLPR